MSKLLTSLEQLHLLRQHAVEEVRTRLSSQQQRSQRFAANVATLTELAAGLNNTPVHSALLMNNHSGYKRNLQRVIDWQKQEQILAGIETQKLKGALLAEAKREKSLEKMMDEHKRIQVIDEQRREQKTTDAISAQCWLRQQRGRE